MSPEGIVTPEIKEPSLDAIEIAGALQGILYEIQSGQRDFDLEEEQVEAFEAIGEELMNGETAGYLECFTGFGKSVVISLMAEATVRAGKRIHIMAPTVAIADHLIGEDGETGLGRFTSLLESRGTVRKNYGGRHAGNKAQVVVDTYQGFLEEARAIKAGRGKLGEFHFIAGDECHRSLGTETSRALYGYMPNAIKLGASATPDFAEDRRSEEVFGRQWFEFSLRRAIEGEPGKEPKASPMRALLMETDATIEVTDAGRDFTEKELSPLMHNFERNGLALGLAQDFVAHGRRGFIACVPGKGFAGESNAHATAMAAALSKMDAGGRKIIAKDIGAHIDKEERRKRLREYRHGEIDVLTFTQYLEEGWDSMADFGINMQPSTSRRRIKQLLGRLARKKPDGRESIFIDFVDKKRGINKEQYTGLHALEVEDDDVDMNHVLGDGQYGGSSAPPSRTRRFDISRFIRPDLLQRLLRVQGRRVKEVLVSASVQTVDPETAEWEARLAAEGMPAELPYNIMLTPKLAEKRQQAVAKLLQLLGIEPTNEQIADEVGYSPHGDIDPILRQYGERVPFTDNLDQLPELYESVDDAVIRGALSRTVSAVLETLSLSERDADIMMLLTGVHTATPMTLHDAGKVHGLSQERTRQIRTKTLSRLRHPERADLLWPYVEEGLFPGEGQQEEPYQKAHRPSSPFNDMPSVLRRSGLGDPASYEHDVRRATEQESHAWLTAKLKELDTLTTKLFQQDDILQLIAQDVEPIGVFVDKELYDERPSDVPDWQVYAAYDVNTLRANGLRRAQDNVLQQLEPFWVARDRVANRPLHPASRSQRSASLAFVDEWIQPMESYYMELQRHIDAYTALATTQPDIRPFQLKSQS